MKKQNKNITKYFVNKDGSLVIRRHINGLILESVMPKGKSRKLKTKKKTHGR